jgi:hypothetical protein
VKASRGCHARVAEIAARRGDADEESLTCVLHEAPLRTLLASPAAASPGHSPGVTIGDEIAGLLDASEANPKNPLLRALHVEYRHSERGARLVAAGFVRYSREYAVSGREATALKRAVGRGGVRCMPRAPAPAASKLVTSSYLACGGPRPPVLPSRDGTHSSSVA